ncbi:MAG: DUF6221 family protein [Blastococcus sp.]
MSDLVEYLLARIAEDDVVAFSAAREEELFGSLAQYAEGDDDPRLTHAARWRPERVRIDAVTRKQIVQMHGETQHACTGVDSHGTAAAPCPTLRLLALPYAGYPGYRDEWRP